MKLYMKIEFFSNPIYKGHIDYYEIVKVNRKNVRIRYTFIEYGEKIEMPLYKSIAMEMSVLTEDEYFIDRL